MKRIGILTGGGDVPGINAAIKAFVWRILDEPCEIIGLRRDWASLLNIIPDPTADNSEWILLLTNVLTRAIDRTGGTILHTSRINPSITRPRTSRRIWCPSGRAGRPRTLGPQPRLSRRPRRRRRAHLRARAA